MKIEMERLGAQAKEKGEKTFKIYKEIKDAEHDVDSLRNEVVANAEKLAFYEEEHDLICTRSKDLETRLVSRDNKINELMKVIDELHCHLKQKDSENQVLSKKLDESNKEVKGIQQKCKSTEKVLNLVRHALPVQWENVS